MVCTPAEAVRLLGTDVENGLSESEATARLARFGPNKITRRSGPPEWKRFLLQFHAPLVYILLGWRAQSRRFSANGWIPRSSSASCS